MLLNSGRLSCLNRPKILQLASLGSGYCGLDRSEVGGSSHVSKRRKLVLTADSMGESSQQTSYLPQLLSVAPMMDWTDVHYRQLARCITKHTWLYTEMVVDQTILHAQPLDRYLWFPPEQHPIVCQLGGSNPDTLAKAAAIVESYGYDEINLNCGCPSDRVAGAGRFGASLMLQPELVAQCCAAVQRATSIPMTVKCRIGVDKNDSYAELCNFVRVVAEQGGITHFIIHARKCILKGLSPAQNRSVPPLRRGWVWALKRDFPELDFSLNGVVDSCQEAASYNALSHASAQPYGVMIGRAAYHYPWQCLAEADRVVFGSGTRAKSRRQVLDEYSRYADSVIGKWGTKRDGTPSPNLKALVKPLIGMMHGERGTKKWKQEIDRILKDCHKRPELKLSEVIQEAAASLPEEVMDAVPQAGTLPEVTIDCVPERPEDFRPLGSGGASVQDEILRELKSRAELDKTQDIDVQREAPGSADRLTGANGLWSTAENHRTEQSCISAN